MSGVCKNQYCESPTESLGMCASCYSYESMTGNPRPPELILWPGKGHPLATTSDVVKMTGMTYRMIDYAIRSFHLSTTVDGNGSGHQRGWSASDVAHLLITYARNRARVLEFFDEVDGVDLSIDYFAVLDWVVSRWPRGVATDWDGSLPEPSATV